MQNNNWIKADAALIPCLVHMDMGWFMIIQKDHKLESVTP
jgi:hypothetical protein